MATRSFSLQPALPSTPTLLSDLHGVNFTTQELRLVKDFRTPAPANYIQDSIASMKAIGINIVRLPFYTNPQVGDVSREIKDSYLNTLQAIIASLNPIQVLVDNHKDGELQDAVQWNRFWNTPSMWQTQLNFWQEIINRVDAYGNVMGYEILNEPVVASDPNYKLLGDYHTFMAKGMRAFTDRSIVFDRENAATGYTKKNRLVPQIVPRDVSNVVFGPHVYYRGDFDALNRAVPNWQEWSAFWGVPVFVGEWAADSQESVDVFVRTFKVNNWGWTWWRWVWFGEHGINRYGRQVFIDGQGTPTTHLVYLTKSVEAELVSF